jgi:hypothetical protein
MSYVREPIPNLGEDASVRSETLLLVGHLGGTPSHADNVRPAFDNIIPGLIAN